jgi:hypothetical protein
MTFETSDYNGDTIYFIPCTGNVVRGDEVRFERATFIGSFRNASFAGFEQITAAVVSESYGKKTQQHTFTLRLENGEKIRIKGRNLYANGVYRKPWADEASRREVESEKHARGAAARAVREMRRSYSFECPL